MLETVDISKFRDTAASTAFKKHVAPQFLQNNWDRKEVIDTKLPRVLSLANYTVYFRNHFTNEKCNCRHQVILEFGFDNRQAIGSNLLKLEMGNRIFDSSADRVSLGILIALTPSSKIMGGWDSSTGEVDEYSLAIRRAYFGILKTSILLISI
jgi:hypothetical protein